GGSTGHERCERSADHEFGEILRRVEGPALFSAIAVSGLTGWGAAERCWFDVEHPLVDRAELFDAEVRVVNRLPARGAASCPEREQRVLHGGISSGDRSIRALARPLA